MTDKEWIVFGYTTTDPCCICGKYPAQIEPRFGYIVCREHADLPPVKIMRDKPVTMHDLTQFWNQQDG